MTATAEPQASVDTIIPADKPMDNKAEPPATKKEDAPKEQKEKPGATLASLLQAATATLNPEKAEDTKEAVKAEPPVQAEQPKPEPEKTVLTGKARENFEKVQTARDAAEKKAAELEKQLAELRAKSDQVSSFEAKEKELSDRLAKAEERAASLSRSLKEASIERDPDFIEKYVNGRDQRIAAAKELASSVDADLVARALRGDESALDEVLSELPASKRIAFSGHMAKVAELDFEKKQAIASAEKTYADLQQQHKQQLVTQMQQTKQAHKQMAAQVVERIFTEDTLKPMADNKELREAALARLQHHIDYTGEDKLEQLMRDAAFVSIQNEVLGVQANMLKERDGKMAELTKELETLRQKVAEQEDFIAKRSSSTPRGATTQTSTATQKATIGDLMRESGIVPH